MEEANRFKISSDFIYIKAMGTAGWIVSILLLQDYDRVDNKTGGEYILIALALTALLIYFFTRPGIYCDEHNVYIKKINGNEIQVPLHTILTIDKSSWVKGGYWYTLEYLNNTAGSATVKFYVDYYSDRFTRLTILLKKANPAVKFT